MSGVSPRSAELSLIALRKVLVLAAPRRNGRPVPDDVRRALAELEAIHANGSAAGTGLDDSPRPVRAFEGVRQAARRLGISDRAVRKRCAAGHLNAVKVGRIWLVEGGSE